MNRVRCGVASPQSLGAYENQSSSFTTCSRILATREHHDNCQLLIPFKMVNATIASMANNSYQATLPPLPSYTLTPVTSLVSFLPDFYLTLILPVAAYWIVSLFFHMIDIYDVWPQYRLHTPEEILKRNHVSRYEVARDVIIQQIIQTFVGAILGLTEPEEVMGKEDYDIACWAQKIRIAQKALPHILGFVGLNAAAISNNVAGQHPLLAGALAGGHYPFLTTGLDVVTGNAVPAFAGWEMFVAKAIYWYLVPAAQFSLAIFVVDTWQYFLHRAMHMNKWLYSMFTFRSLYFVY